MGGPCKVTLGSPCDHLRTHLPPQCQRGPTPPLERGGSQMSSSRYQGKLISSLPGGKKFGDTEVPYIWDSR